MTQMTMVQAINNALREEMRRDDRVVVLGEDVGRNGGVFRCTEGLIDEFPDRVFDTPLAEGGIIGSAIGMALYGLRPVPEIQFMDFIYPAFDQIVSQLAKMAYRSLGKLRLPVVVRIPFGGGIGAVEHHSESPEALFAHTPGLRVVACGDPADAYAMIQQAISCPDPVIFFEPKRRYWDKTDVDLAGGLAAAAPLHKARTLASGTDVTLLCYGPMVRTCVEAAVAAGAAPCGGLLPAGRTDGDPPGRARLLPAGRTCRHEQRPRGELGVPGRTGCRRAAQKEVGPLQSLAVPVARRIQDKRRDSLFEPPKALAEGRFQRPFRDHAEKMARMG